MTEPSEQVEGLIRTYSGLERARNGRNRWIALGAGGVAVGAIVGILTGDVAIGGVVAAGSALAVESMALDSQDAVTSYRRDMQSLVRAYGPLPEPEVMEAPPQPAES